MEVKVKQMKAYIENEVASSKRELQNKIQL